MRKLRFLTIAFIATAIVMLAANNVTATTDDLATLNDEFDSANTLKEWQSFQVEGGWPDMLKKIDINESSKGKLYLEPYISGWYGDAYAPYLFKEVSGDFIATINIQAKGKETDIPTAEWSLAGLMVREPRKVTPDTWKPHGENWVFITTGVADNVRKPVFETKTTVNSDSKLRLVPSQTGPLDLRIARIGAWFYLLYRRPEGKWILTERFNRPDMSEQLQVGINAYSGWYTVQTIYDTDPLRYNTTLIKNGNPDLVLLVDYMHFERPVLPQGVSAEQIADPKFDRAQLMDILSH